MKVKFIIADKNLLHFIIGNPEFKTLHK